MQNATKLTCLILGLATLVAPTLAADDLETSQMVDQARHWQKKRRDDLAAEAWRKVLRFEPKHPEALAKLSAIEAHTGNLPPPPPPAVAPKQKPSAPAKLTSSAPSRSKASAPGTTKTSDPTMNFSSSLELTPAKPRP